MLKMLDDKLFAMILDYLHRGILKSLSIEPKVYKRKSANIKYYVFISCYREEPGEIFSAKHTNAIKVLNEFYDNYKKGKVISFSFSKNKDIYKITSQYTGETTKEIILDYIYSAQQLVQNSNDSNLKDLLIPIDNIINTIKER